MTVSIGTQGTPLRESDSKLLFSRHRHDKGRGLGNKCHRKRKEPLQTEGRQSEEIKSVHYGYSHHPMQISEKGSIERAGGKSQVLVKAR